MGVISTEYIHTDKHTGKQIDNQTKIGIYWIKIIQNLKQDIYDNPKSSWIIIKSDV